MAFEKPVKDKITQYIGAHVGDEAWHIAYFDFIDDTDLAKRLGEEFISTRYIYKMLEGLGADDWLQRAQIRNQILSYASIYEAVIHHLLFDVFSSEPLVLSLTKFVTKKQISIPANSAALLEKHLLHEGRKIIPTYEAIGRTDESKVRFDKKAECAEALGLIEPWLKEELIEFYEARNAIHIHAEIRKSMTYQLDLSKRAYRRMQPFKDNIVAGMAKRASGV